MTSSAHSHADCLGHRCQQAVVQIHGWFYITFGHAGFNAWPNNSRGYGSEESARKAIRMHQRSAFTQQCEGRAACASS